MGQLSLAQIGGALGIWNVGTAFGVDMTTGSRTWTITPGPEPDTPALFGVFRGRLYGISATPRPSLLGFGPDGTATVKVPVAQAFDEIGVSPSQASYAGVGVGDGVVVVAVIRLAANPSATVVGIDLTDGHALWHRQVSAGNAAFIASLTGIVGPARGGAVDEQHCYLQDGDSDALILTSLSSVTGALKGTVNLALDTASGSQLWSNPDLDALAVTAGNGQLYVLNGQHDVEALGSRTGRTVWHTPNPAPDAAGDTTGPYLTALSASSSLLAVPLWTTGSGIVVLSAVDGRPLWAYQDPVATDTSWAVLASASTVYGLSDAALYAFPTSAS